VLRVATELIQIQALHLVDRALLECTALVNWAPSFVRQAFSHRATAWSVKNALRDTTAHQIHLSQQNVNQAKIVLIPPPIQFRVYLGFTQEKGKQVALCVHPVCTAQCLFCNLWHAHRAHSHWGNRHFVHHVLPDSPAAQHDANIVHWKQDIQGLKKPSVVLQVSVYVM